MIGALNIFENTVEWIKDSGGSVQINISLA